MLEPAYRARPLDEECEIVGQTWVIGHLFGADVDIGDAVDQVVRGISDMAGCSDDDDMDSALAAMNAQRAEDPATASGAEAVQVPGGEGGRQAIA